MSDRQPELIAPTPIQLRGETDTLALGATLAGSLAGGEIIHLHGPLGAGKTTLVRGLMRELGHSGPVKSPTFTLVESYQQKAFEIHHFDLYRLSEPEELEWMGIRDYFSKRSIVLIEWPCRGAGILPAPTLEIRLEVKGHERVAHLFGHLSESTLKCPPHP